MADNKRFSVKQAIWIVAALKAYSAYKNDKECAVEDCLINGPDIMVTAPKYTKDKVDPARFYQHYNGDHKACTYRFLREVKKDGRKFYRFTAKGEFEDRYIPEDLNWNEEIVAEGEKIALKTLKSFVEGEEYRHIINNVFFPTLKEYDPQITAEKYKEILKEQLNTSKESLDIIYYLYTMGGVATCKQIAAEYGNKAAHYVTNSINIAKTVAVKTGCSLYKRETGRDCYWAVLFYGKKTDRSEEGEFLYKLREPLKRAVEEMEREGAFSYLNEKNESSSEYKNKVEYDKNIILYGPPGTGKTYSTAIYAVAICKGMDIKAVEKQGYKAVMEEYKGLEDRIAFTTFHQSYGYEEFIEGIKPVTEKGNNQLEYKIESGVFKKFCDRAKAIKGDEAFTTVNANGQIWKLTIKNGDMNPIKEECFNEGNARMGFDYDSADARAFVEDVDIGDIILSFKTRKSIDGIGVVTGEVEELSDKSAYRLSRRVTWLAKNISEDITGINRNKVLPRKTFTRVPDMNPKDVFNILKKYPSKGKETRIVENKEPYVFIIDEINRGNISKIFGELITLIENTKRAGEEEAASAILPYSGESFSVPSNVYILGTMNTADRSIALMDTALRRRFSFIEMTPRKEVLNGIIIDGLNVAEMLEVINKRIECLYDREHTIGHGFFISLKKEPTVEKLAAIFERSVIPLLQEYFYEDYSKIMLVLGDNDKSSDEYKFITESKTVGSSIFKGNTYDMDIPEYEYKINRAAFKNINSYKEIM